MTSAAGPGHDPAVVSALTAGYSGVTALEDISFSLRPGSITALLGANGSGKSTLFSVLLGLVTPSAGEVHLFGERPAAARRHNRVSYVPQQDAVDMAFPITVEEVVMQGRFAHQGLTRRPSAADRAAAEQALADVSLLELRQRGIGQLSGGQRKRAFVARALAQEAPLMLLDEPFAGVDRGSEELITRVLRRLRSSGAAVLVSTHHLEGVRALADEVLLLHRRILASGRPEEVLTETNLALAFGAAIGGELGSAQ